MGLKEQLRKTLNSLLKRRGYEIVASQHLYEWQKNPVTGPSYKRSDLPAGAEEYLQLNNPRLQDLKARYESFNDAVTAPLVWTNDLLRPEDILYFRGDNAYVWQVRGPNMNILSYALATYYAMSIDRLDLLEQLEEDELFGNFVFDIGGRPVSRDLLDSIVEFYFLDKHLGLSQSPEKRILDIGAGYGRLAHRMTSILPDIKEYLCTDGVAASSFISEYHLRFRKLEGKAKVVPLDEIEKELSDKKIDLAVNIHSFSECGISAIEWWLSLLEKSGVKHLVVAPNFCNHGGELLQTNDGEDFSGIIENHGYRLIAKEPKYKDPIVQKHAIGPTYYNLFELR